MIDDMGIFRTTIEIAPLNEPARRRAITDVMVDTGAEYNWVPREVLDELGILPERTDRFETADGRVLALCGEPIDPNDRRLRTTGRHGAARRVWPGRPEHAG